MRPAALFLVSVLLASLPFFVACGNQDAAKTKVSTAGQRADTRSSEQADNSPTNALVRSSWPGPYGKNASADVFRRYFREMYKGDLQELGQSRYPTRGTLRVGDQSFALHVGCETPAPGDSAYIEVPGYGIAFVDVDNSNDPGSQPVILLSDGRQYSDAENRSGTESSSNGGELFDLYFSAAMLGDRLTKAGRTYDEQVAAANAAGDKSQVKILKEKLESATLEVRAEIPIWSWKLQYSCGTG
jgi:hypothetical protein